MTTTSILTKAQYEQNIKDKVGTLMFGDDFYDATSYVDCAKVRKQFGLKGKIQIIITTQSHPEFKNIANLDIPYKTPVCSAEDTAGAYRHTYGPGYSMWATNNPVGDAYIITK
jgi:hypothetical protein